MKVRLAELEAEKAVHVASRNVAPIAPNISVHPNVAAVYRRKVEELESLLDYAELRAGAMELIWSLINKIVLTPKVDGGLEALVHGDLARILALCTEQRKPLTRLAYRGFWFDVRWVGCGGLTFAWGHQ